LVESQLPTAGGDRFLSRPLPLNFLTKIARQQLDAEKDDERNREQHEEAQRQALGHHSHERNHGPYASM
jgi:hypothetical protein